MLKFVMLVGIPGSGKSTWAKERMKYRQKTFIYLSSDEIRNTIAKDTGETNRGKLNALTFKTMNETTVMCLEKGISIIYDATNLNQKDRKHILKKVLPLKKEKELELNCFVFNTPFEVCYERNKRRENPVPNEYLKRYRDKFVHPTQDEGFDLIIDL